MSKKRPNKITVSFDNDDWEVLHKALELEYSSSAGWGNKERSRLVRLAVCVVSRAVIRQKVKYPYAADLRAETKNELAERIGEESAASFRQPELRRAVQWQSEQDKEDDAKFHEFANTMTADEKIDVADEMERRAGILRDLAAMEKFGSLPKTSEVWQMPPRN
jgi:hypothetical protein